MNRGTEQYHIIQKLGEGGMGTVYLAEDSLIQRQVAIKQLNKTTDTSDAMISDRFQQEALALARLNHPNITHLYSFIPNEDSYWMVMEYVTGKTLEAWIKLHGKVTAILAASIAVHILDGLDHAHRKGIIHRDLKPANVMVSEEGEIKIMDFGIARIRNSQRITRHGKSVGTLEYMAPEQIQGNEGDERTDIYAVGNIMYEMLCGNTPFCGDTDYHIMKAKLETSPESILKFNPSVPQELQKIIFKALERKEDKRYATANEMKLAIVKLMSINLLNDQELNRVLSNVQQYEPSQEAVSVVNQLLTKAKSISGNFHTISIKKINKPVLLLCSTVLICALLLIWAMTNEPSPNKDIDQENLVVVDTTTQPSIAPQSVESNESPNEMYKRIEAQRATTEAATPTNNEKKTTTTPAKKKQQTREQQMNDAPSEQENRNERSRNTEPADVPEGRTIRVMLDETLSSEDEEKDGNQIRLHCLDNIEVNGRIIFRKGARVTGKIVDVIPSTNERKKALIGFVIQKIEAVDGSMIRLSSDRFRLFADDLGQSVAYRKGQTFSVELGRGRVQ